MEDTKAEETQRLGLDYVGPGLMPQVSVYEMRVMMVAQLTSQGCCKT